MMNFLNKSAIIVLISICSNGYSQLFAPHAGFSDTTNYTISGINDSLYFFTSNTDSTYLLADTNLYNNCSIEWYEYVPASGYQLLSFTGTKLVVEADTIGKSYQLLIRNATDTLIQRCWVFKNNFRISITPKNNEQQLSTSSYVGCDLIEPIWVLIDSSDISYVNPVTHEELTCKLKYKLSWKKEFDVEEGKIVAGKIPITGQLKSKITDPYWKDMWYTAIVTDASQQERRDSVYVRSIRPHADFTVNHIKLDDKTYYPDKDSAYYYYYSEEYRGEEINSAPAKFFIENKSENAHSYLWNFDEVDGNKDTITLETNADSIIYEYIRWGTFTPKLTARHSVEWALLTCEDVMEAEEEIEILQPMLSVRNAISVPSGDNNVFRFVDESIIDFEISIFNRNGMKVHHFKGNIRDWDGWDGKYNNGDNYVPTGVYYYIVKNYTVIQPNDEEAERSSTWQSSSESSSNDSGTSTGSTTTDTKSVGTNTQFRGFFHVFNNE